MSNSSLPAVRESQTGGSDTEVIDLPVVDVVDRSLVSYPANTTPAVRSGMTKDLNVIQQAVLEAQSREFGWAGTADPDVSSESRTPRTTPEGPWSLNVYVTPGGEVVVGDRGANQTARLSIVVGDTFYIDLNAIQHAVLEQQQNGGQVADKDRVYVDNNGEVMLGSQVGDHSRVSDVVGDTFYARDLAVEAYTAENKMPAAVKVSDGTYEGYAYAIHNDFGDSYELFIYYDPSYRVYRVALVSPRMGGDWDPHGGHLWPDGTLCLTHNAGSGYASMEQTYAKSVLWTYGASLYRRGYGFQFNLGQDGDSRA